MEEDPENPLFADIPSSANSRTPLLQGHAASVHYTQENRNQMEDEHNDPLFRPVSTTSPEEQQLQRLGRNTYRIASDSDYRIRYSRWIESLQQLYEPSRFDVTNKYMNKYLEQKIDNQAPKSGDICALVDTFKINLENRFRRSLEPDVGQYFDVSVERSGSWAEGTRANDALEHDFLVVFKAKSNNLYLKHQKLDMPGIFSTSLKSGCHVCCDQPDWTEAEMQKYWSSQDDTNFLKPEVFFEDMVGKIVQVSKDISGIAHPKTTTHGPALSVFLDAAGLTDHLITIDLSFTLDISTDEIGRCLEEESGSHLRVTCSCNACNGVIDLRNMGRVICDVSVWKITACKLEHQYFSKHKKARNLLLILKHFRNWFVSCHPMAKEPLSSYHLKTAVMHYYSRRPEQTARDSGLYEDFLSVLSYLDPQVRPQDLTSYFIHGDPVMKKGDTSFHQVQYIAKEMKKTEGKLCPIIAVMSMRSALGQTMLLVIPSIVNLAIAVLVCFASACSLFDANGMGTSKNATCPPPFSIHYSDAYYISTTVILFIFCVLLNLWQLMLDIQKRSFTNVHCMLFAIETAQYSLSIFIMSFSVGQIPSIAIGFGVATCVIGWLYSFMMSHCVRTRSCCTSTTHYLSCGSCGPGSPRARCICCFTMVCSVFSVALPLVTHLVFTVVGAVISIPT